MRTLAVVAIVIAGLLGGTGCASCENCQNCRNCRECRGDMKPAVAEADADAHADADSAAGIRIESARYGRDDEWVDVTPQVRGLIKGDTIVFPRDLQATLKVDPVPGRMKYVEMTLIIDGRPVEMTLGDSLHLTPLRLRAPGADVGRAAASTRPKQ